MSAHPDPYAYSLELEELLGIPPLIRLNGKTPIDTEWSTGPRLDPNAWREKLRGWDGNIGMLTGALRGGGYLIVLDLDARVLGWEDSIERIVRECGISKETVTVLTGGVSGSQHFYYVSPVPIRKGALRDFPGIDVQAEGAQVVVPHSTHPSGRVYEWEYGYAPGQIALRELTRSAVELLGEHHGTRAKRGDVDERAWLTVELLMKHFGAHTPVKHRDRIDITRPGKERGASGTVGALEEPDAFYCFSSSWVPFERERAYSYRELCSMAGVPSPNAKLAASIKVEGDEWEEPIALNDPGDLPPFPIQVLPEWLGEHAVQLSNAKQTPLDLAGTLSLAMLAAASGGRVLVSPHAGWAEFTNLFIAVAMRSGEGKSPVFEVMSAPLREWEQDQAERSVSAILEAEQVRDLARARSKTARNNAVKESNAKKRAELEAESLAFALEADLIEVPVAPRLLCRDVTSEALEVLLRKHRGSMSLLSPEGGVFDVFAGRYSGIPNIDVYLSGWNGEELMIDRIGRESFRVKRPVLTIGATFQPAVLHRAAHVAINRERGVLARFLFVLPNSMRGWRDKRARSINDSVARTYAERLYGITEHLAHWSDPMAVTLNTDAREALLDFDQALEDQLRPDGELEHVAEFVSKLAGTCARLSALLHIAHEPEPERWRLMIDVPTVERAITLGRYFLAHALGVYRFALADVVTEDADRVLTWALRRGEPTFTRRDAQHGLSGFERAEQLDAPLRELCERGWLRELPTGRTGSKGGRPPSRLFELHPHARQFRHRHIDDTDTTER